MKHYFLKLTAFMICCTAVSCKKNEILISPSPEADIAIGIRAGTQWYASPNGNGNGQSPSTPTLLRSLNDGRLQPGDVVNLISNQGIFTHKAIDGAVLGVSKSGAPNNPITYKSYPAGTLATIAGYNVFNAISMVDKSYINIEGIRVIGDKAGTNGGPVLTLEAARDTAAKIRTYFLSNGNIRGYPWNNVSRSYQTSGIYIDDSSHHINIRKCVINDMPGSGISMKNSDYITIEDNEVTNCANYQIYGMSGISTVIPFNYDNHSSQEYEIIVRRNKTRNNRSLVNYYTKGALSDGNGIIIDVNDKDISGNAGNPYTGKTLVENNITSDNGGAGVHLVTARNVNIINNTSYNNCQNIAYAEMDAVFSCRNVNFWSNIMYAKNGGRCYRVQDGVNANIVYFKNVLYNNFQPISNINNVNGLTLTDYKTTNPNFISAGTNFQLNTGSSAANFGSGNYGKYSLNDILGVARRVDAPNSKYPDCGAYESFN